MRPILKGVGLFYRLGCLDKPLRCPYCIAMIFSKKRRIISRIFIIIAVIVAVTVGLLLGFAFSAAKNVDIRRDLADYQPALPSQILDRNGELITELFSDEKREIVPIDEIPKHLIYALISREDTNFFKHHGFSFRGTFRAAWNIITGQYHSGGSTITQQVAGRHYADRSDISVKRKLKELWYAFLIERSLTKNEILEIYLNEVYFGHNAYGVEAASQFYFGHSVRDITIAESAMLVIQLANPAKYSPINNPENARERQLDVLKQMVDLGYATKEEADISFNQYWDSYNYRRSNIASAYFDNQSKAPYFSEYVCIQLNDMLYGAVDVNKDGYTVQTTLDLKFQKAAEEMMTEAIKSINERFKERSSSKLAYVDRNYIPIVDMLALAFNLEDIKVAGAKQKRAAEDYYYESLNPLVDVLSLMFGINDLKSASSYGYAKENQQAKKNTIEGALITIENSTGHIVAMVGGSDFKTKQYNRATDAKVMPGSTIKPLYYSAAISSRKYTPATRLYDGPVVFFDELGRSFTPMNFLGTWEGSVLLRNALAKSMNVPSLQVLQGVGFDVAIDRMSRLLGMEDQKNDIRLFPRNFPLGLGVTAVSPLQMARAFATFANQGRSTDPMAIVSVTDRNGNIVLEPEKERIRNLQRTGGKDKQIMTPQEAFIMTSMLESTIEYGTLRSSMRAVEGSFADMALAGKTGTTQNWGDAWTVGFSPYYTTAIWFGFDTPGNSLGREFTGATIAGPVWAKYMQKIHEGLQPKKFERPTSGIVVQRVCRKSGQLPTEFCTDGTFEEYFLAGTEPKQFCTVHEFEKNRNAEIEKKIENSLMIEDFPIDSFDFPELSKPDNLDINPPSSGSADIRNPLLD